jgi:hypothetical protein
MGAGATSERNAEANANDAAHASRRNDASSRSLSAAATAIWWTRTAISSSTFDGNAATNRKYDGATTSIFTASYGYASATQYYLEVLLGLPHTFNLDHHQISSLLLCFHSKCKWL